MGQGSQKTPFVTGADGAEMVLIPAGEFRMGSDDGYDNEMPIHIVNLDAYYIDVYEVTNARYAKFLNEYGRNTDAAGHELLDIDNSNWCLIEKVQDTYSPKAGYENHPVILVSWYGAAAYAQFYGRRLPTEAEWEKAARGGLVRRKYPWGDDAPDGTQCNFADKNTDYDWSDKNVDDGYEHTAPVDTYSPNGYGLYDMAGNVWKWCADEYDPYYYSEGPKDNPTGPGYVIVFADDDFTKVETDRVVRGGSWADGPRRLRVANRFRNKPVDMHFLVGFRCVQDAKTSS